MVLRLLHLLRDGAFGDHIHQHLPVGLKIAAVEVGREPDGVVERGLEVLLLGIFHAGDDVRPHLILRRALGDQRLDPGRAVGQLQAERAFHGVDAYDPVLLRAQERRHGGVMVVAGHQDELVDVGLRHAVLIDAVEHQEVRIILLVPVVAGLLAVDDRIGDRPDLSLLGFNRFF